jgi:hypothetical protein
MLPDLQPPFNDEHVDTCVACAGAPLSHEQAPVRHKHHRRPALGMAQEAKLWRGRRFVKRLLIGDCVFDRPTLMKGS